MMEESVGTLTCQVNALPAPNITLRTLDNDLMTVEGRNPTVTVSERGYTNHRYTASTTFKAPNCTSRMILTCTVTHNLARVQGNQIILKLLCPPRRATIEGLELLDDYEYYKGDQLNFSFVLIAIPDPDVYNVTSELNGRDNRINYNIDNHRYCRCHLTNDLRRVQDKASQEEE
uniref:Uncharacterized protein n=1 Tax=Biomphalaria glabrata TaxID=6526 RepID=A0A2C9L0Y4_BIOGL